MAYRLNLSDGTTTIDLYDGSDAKVREGGLSLPAPAFAGRWSGGPLVDGERLLSSNYGNRAISLTLRIWGSSLADLATNVRAIERLLNDARERTKLGYGSKVYLEYQWGDSNGQSIFFDIQHGELELPGDFLSVALASSFYIRDAQLVLTCLPFGRYANQDINQASLNNSQSPSEQDEAALAGTSAAYNAVYADNWEAQTFTPGSSISCKGVCLRGTRLATVTTLTVGIYATSGGLPTGAALGSATLDISGIQSTLAADSQQWMRIWFASPISLTGSTVYSIVVSHAGGDVNNNFRWMNQAADYGGGQRCYSSNAGSSWTADAANDFRFAILKAETKTNYQDVTTAEGYGDIPAKLYAKIALSSASGSKKVWLAKRSGTRQTDSLWLEGEAADALTNNNSANFTVSAGRPVSGLSGGATGQVHKYNGLATIAATDIGRFDYTISSPPRGQFRVLARVRSKNAGGNYANMKWGMGWSYGGLTESPAAADGDYQSVAADDTWEILDLGLVNIPPIPESEIATNNSFQLRLFCNVSTSTDITDGDYWQLDWIFLLPIDEGVVIVNSVASTDVLAVDGISYPPSVFLLNGSNVITGFPDHVGKELTLGRENTRIYILRDDVKGVTFTSNLKYQPRFVLV